MKISRTSRIVQLLTILQSNGNYTISGLAKILGISQRTLYRDTKDLKQTGLLRCFDTREHRYILNPHPSLPPIALSKEEAFSLLLLLYKAGRHFNLPFTCDILTAGLGIENGLRREVRQFCSESLRHISVIPAPQAKMDLLDQKFVQILEAIQLRRVLNIRYGLSAEQKTVTTDLSPYHLFYAERSWHTIGQSSFHRAVHTFKLSQIGQISPLDKYFVEDRKFDLREYFGYAWSLLREGQIYTVELKFSPEIAAEVAEVQWHETQTVSFENNGSAILRFQVDGLNEIIWWILSYGDRVEVLEPCALRQRIAEIARRMAHSSRYATSD